MKTRVLELLKEPKNIQKEDLQILKDQIQEFPYLQNVRALHLYGVHLYESENYQKELSKTAAYTTDKKNLYHLINGKLETKQAEVVFPKISPVIESKKPYPAYVPKNGGFPLRRPDEKLEISAEESPYTAVQPLPEVSNQPVEVEGQRNRILFEGEENFLNEENTVKIDLESSKESGNLVTEKLNTGSENKTDSVGIGSEIKSEVSKPENRIEDLNSEINESESEKISGKTETVAVESEMQNQEIPVSETEKGDTQTEKINFNQSEIKVSPDENSEHAEEVIAHDKAVSFQEITPLETEIKEETEEEETVSQDEVETPKDFSSETAISVDQTEEFAAESEMKNKDKPAFESEKDEVEETEINFNQSEIRVSPNQNLEEAVEAIAEDKTISFQEIAPLETEIKEETKDEDTVAKNEVQNQTDFSSETIISEDKIESEDEKQKVEDDSQLSFHGTESFLPEVKIESKTPVQQEIPVQNSPSKNKYEEEMRRLIEQVELKMKEAKKDSAGNEKTTEKEQENAGSEISFAETQSFEVETQSPEVVENEEKTEVKNEVSSADDAEISSQTETDSQLAENEAETAPSTSWKPMSFETNVLDYSIGKKVGVTEQKPTEKAEPEIKEQAVEAAVIEETVAEEENESETETKETSKSIEEDLEEEEKNAPAFNVSFFGNDISSFIKSNQKIEEETQPEIKAEAPAQTKIKPDQRQIPSILDSNVPVFINTWQSWLKIDRSAEVEKEKVEIKEKAIEAFIENNPKISQLKDESSFVIKERNDDISHLMTETLAKLYTEQKLYSKAIQAYQILIGKHPEKKSYFEERIQEVKDIRGR